jgi:hypothetical protein
MSVIENLDIVLGAKTTGLDAAVAKELSQLERLKKAARDTGKSGDVGLGGVTLQATKQLTGSIPGVSQLSSSIGGVASSLSRAAAAAGPAGIAIAGGAAVAVVGVTALVHVWDRVAKQMEEIDQLSDAAKKVGTSFADLSTLRLSLGQTSGLDAGAIDSSLQKMTLNLADAAAKGSGQLHDRLQMIGLDAGKLLQVGPLDAINQIAAATSNLKNPTDQLVVAYGLFGKQGAALVSSLREGPEEIERMAQLAEKLGMNLSQAQAEQVGAANDAWAELGMIATGTYRQIAAEVSPAIAAIAGEVMGIGTSFSEWHKSLPAIVDNTAYFAGSIADAYEAAVVLHTTLRNIVSLNWDDVGADIQSAFTFDRGAKAVEAIWKQRWDAENKADIAGMKKRSDDLEIERLERKNDLAKEMADLEKAASGRADAALEAQARAITANSESIMKKMDSLREEVAILEKIEKIAKAGGTPNESRIREQFAFDKLGSTMHGDEFKKLMDRKEALEKGIDKAARARNEPMAEPEAEKLEDPVMSKGAVSAQAGSVEAWKALVQRDTDRTNQAIKEAHKQRQEQLAALKGIEKGIKEINPVRAIR